MAIQRKPKRYVYDTYIVYCPREAFEGGNLTSEEINDARANSAIEDVKQNRTRIVTIPCEWIVNLDDDTDYVSVVRKRKYIPKQLKRKASV